MTYRDDERPPLPTWPEPTDEPDEEPDEGWAKDDPQPSSDPEP
jgi:hypothetical protein